MTKTEKLKTVPSSFINSGQLDVFFSLTGPKLLHREGQLTDVCALL